MSQQTKKTPTAANTQSNEANREVTLKAVETMKDTADSMMKKGAETVREMVNSSAQEAKKVQAQATEFQKNTYDQFMTSADMASKSMAQMAEVSRDYMEAMIESGNIASVISKSMSDDMMNYMSNSFSSSAESAKEIFNCRTFNDFVNMNNKMFHNSAESFFAFSQKMSNSMFRMATDALQPINESLSEAQDKMSKVMNKK